MSLNNAVATSVICKNIRVISEAIDAEKANAAKAEEERLRIAILEAKLARLPQVGQRVYISLPCGCEMTGVVHTSTLDNVWVDVQNYTDNSAKSIHEDDCVLFKYYAQHAIYVFPAKHGLNKHVTSAGKTYWTNNEDCTLERYL